MISRTVFGKKVRRDEDSPFPEHRNRGAALGSGYFREDTGPGRGASEYTGERWVRRLGPSTTVQGLVRRRKGGLDEGGLTEARSSEKARSKDD